MKMFNKSQGIVTIILCVSFILSGCGLGNETVNYEEEYFGKETYAELDKKATKEDEEAVKPIMELAEEAFSYIGTEKEAEDKFGELGIYSLTNDEKEGTVREEHEIEFLTAKLEENTGYMWIHYTQTGYDTNDEVTYGAAEINSRWTLNKVNGEWIVTKTNEPA